MVFVKTIGRKIDFAGNCIVESTAYYFDNIINFIFTPIIEIKIFEIKILSPKKIVLEGRFSSFRIRLEYVKLKLNGLQRDHPPAWVISYRANVGVKKNIVFLRSVFVFGIFGKSPGFGISLPRDIPTISLLFQWAYRKTRPDCMIQAFTSIQLDRCSDGSKVYTFYIYYYFIY